MCQNFYLLGLQFIVVLLPLLALLIPVLMYLTSGWKLRRREIITCFNDDAVESYFQTFFLTDFESCEKKPGKETSENDGLSPEDIEKLRDELNRHYVECIGRAKFLLPGLLLLSTATCFLLFSALAVCWLLSAEGPAGARESLAALALAGFAGGYMWVLQLLISRWQERRLSPSDLFWGAFRLIIAVPLALALTAFFKDAVHQAALAFMLGAFPTRTLITIVRRTAAKALSMGESFDDPAINLTKIQGIERDQAEIFAQEGVGTILQLAYSDPVDLTIRTGFSFSYVIDCCSQALAYLCFEDALPKLRQFALRGAQEITTFVYQLSRMTDQDKKVMDEEQGWAEKTLDDVARELKMEKTALRRTFDEIAFDPYAQFLDDVWQPDWN